MRRANLFRRLTVSHSHTALVARLLTASVLLLLALAAALALSSCSAGQALGNALNIETNPYKGEVPPSKLGTSALNGQWRIGVSNVSLDDPQGILGFTAQDFVNEVNGQTFWFDAGAIANYSYPFSIAISDSHLLRLDQYRYKLTASGTVTVYTDFGERRFWAELEIAGAVNSSYTCWEGDGALTYRELDTGDITGGVSLSFRLDKV
jgi:hypothetical protein